MTTRTFIVAVSCLLVAATLGLARAHAQAASSGDIEAGRTHFNSGVEYIRDGDLKGALIEFKRAYAAAPNYRVLYNLGQVSMELRDYTEAQGYFKRYLADGGADIEAARRREVEATVTKLSGRIATVLVSCNLDGAELFVDDVSIGHSPLSEPVRVSVGTRRVTAAISGSRPVTRVIEAAGGETLSVNLELVPTAHEVAVRSTDAAPASAAQASSGPSAALWLGLGTGALAVGTGVVGVLAAIDGAKYREAIRRRTTAAELDALHGRAATKALVTDILLGATALTGSLALVFAIQGNSHRDVAPAHPEAARAWLTLGPGSVAVAGRLE